MRGKIACVLLLRPGINQLLYIMGWAVAESTWRLPLNDSVYPAPHGADTGVMINAVSILPPRPSMGTLLKFNEIISGRLVLGEANRCWLLLEGKAILHNLPHRQKNTLVQRPGLSLMVSPNKRMYHVTGVKVVCGVNQGGI